MQTFQSKFSTYISPSANDADITRSDLRSATAGWNGAYLTRRRFVRRTRAEGCDRSDNPSRRENGENRYRIQYDAGSVKEGSKRTGIFQKFAEVAIVHFQKTSDQNRTRLRISYRVTIAAGRNSKKQKSTAISGKEQ